MALDAHIVGTNLDTDGNIKVALPLTPAKMGGVRIFSENDPGTISGSPLLRSPEISMDYRLRTGTDSIWDNEVFNYVAQNISKFRYNSTTMTTTWAGGAMNTNGAGIVTTNTGVAVQTYRHFPLLGSGVVYVDTTMCLSNAMPVNVNIEFGLFQTLGGTTLPSDGVYFRINSSGIMGVVNNAGTEQTTAPLAFTQEINKFANFVISISQGAVEFWINNVLMGSLERAIGAGQVISAGAVPYAVRHHNIGVAGAAVQGKFASYSVSEGDIDTNRLWATAMSGQAMSGIQGASGNGGGTQTANNTNSTAPTTAVLSNTAASYTTLGGKFVLAAVAGAETDYALFGYLNPAATTAITGRNLVIRGVWVDTYNAVVAVATTPTVLEWSIGVGSTAVSLANTDGSNARAPRRLALGVQSFTVGALAGAPAERVDINLDAPVVVEPGCYLHIILRVPYGTATATELFRGHVGFNCYWE
jgi:hypothetical protein